MADASDVRPVPAALVKAWLDRSEILLVDVRETKEYEVEHIAGALLLPLSSFEPDMFPVLPGRKVVLHCAIGKRSEAAGKMLARAGHAGVIHMEGGLQAWKAAGFATEVQILPPDEAEEGPAEPVFLCPLPGEILAREFCAPLGIANGDLASALGVPPSVVDRVMAGELDVDVEMSLRLARYFSTAADFWIHLQVEHELERARHRIGERIRQEIRPRTA